MLAAFVVVVVGLAMEYKQSGSLDGVVAGLLVRNTIDQLQRGYTEVIVALVNAVEAKDIYTRGHTQRVTDLAVQIGEEMRIAPDRLRILSQAAMLHDIGKIGVPDSILNKTGPLTDAEYEVVKEHPVRGHAIIKEVRSLQPALGGIRHHHERVDGSGYPDGLVGDTIPLEARIIATADVFDALTSARSYRDAWPVSRALEVIQSEAGHGLDPVCVAALGRVLAREQGAVALPWRERLGTTSEAVPATLTARTMAD
jgi:HD-GYP domain-containing protein (c-di-GMP phosphodiesterase class II)